MQKAISRLKAIILTPSMIIVWVLGLTMAFMQGQIILTFGWFHLKLLMVVGISAMHGVFVGMNKKIGTEKAPKPKTLRMINEVPFVLMIVAVIAVVVQPF